MPAFAPTHPIPRAVVSQRPGTVAADHSDESDSDVNDLPASSTSMQPHDLRRLIKLEKVCTDELTGNCVRCLI
jgi:hypothetical protein